MQISLKNIGETLFKGYVCFVGLWVVSALTFQIFFLYLHFTGQEEKTRDISNKIAWKIDGTFKNDPDNIWYEGPSK